MQSPSKDMHVNNEPSTSKSRNFKYPNKTRKCVICGGNPNDYPDRRFHGFPSNPELSNKWAELVDKKWISQLAPNKRINRFLICSSHFEQNSYFSASKLKLKPTAVPKLDVPTVNVDLLKKQLSSSIRCLPAEPMDTSKKGSLSVSNQCAFCYAYKSYFPDRQFFSFPANAQMCKKWVAACNNSYLFSKNVQTLHHSYKVCSEHFQKSDFLSPAMYRLKPSACPIVNSGNNASKQQSSALIATLKNKLSLKLNPKQNREIPSDDTSAISSPLCGTQNTKISEGETSAISSSLHSTQNTKMFETSEGKISAISSSLCNTQNTMMFETAKGETSAISSPLYSTQNTMMFETTEGKDCISVSSEVILSSKDLFLNQQYCDVFIRVKELEFPAHRAILSACSSVFETMCDMREKGNDIIYIEDCDASVFLNFLCFVYCGETESVSKENVFNLFAIAHKYDVQDLRTKCVEFIKENLSFDTFCDTLTLGLQHSETELIKLATAFFTKNLQEIIVTDKWQSLLVKHPIQCNELFVKALAPNKNSIV